MEQIQLFLVYTALFFLLFLLMTILIERLRKRLQPFWRKNYRFFTGIPGTTVMAMFCVIGGILFLRKLVYYLLFIPERFLILPLIFSLVFLLIAWLVEKYAKKIPSALKKISWNTFFKVIVVWAGIMALRKLLYYIPIEGVTQTKDSIWWIDENNSFYLPIFLFIVLIMILRGIKGKLNLSEKRDGIINFLEVVVIFGFVASIYIAMFFQGTNISIPVLSYLAKFLLSLKIICSGKYMGLVTGFLLAYYFTYEGKTFKVSIGKLVGVPVLLLSIGMLVYLTIPSTPSAWWSKFHSQLHAAEVNQQERAIEDLLDAAFSLRDRTKKSLALGEIARAIANSGDTQWATSVANRISNGDLRDSTLKEIQQRMKKND
ncbi:MAG: hypothetical protein PVH61_30060 [Candidatus Aminicenantes bacterium]|jgi:hypothetical protein